MLRSKIQQMSRSFEYLIVGGGNAAGYACREFVAQGIEGAGKIGIVTAEAVAPYERPALSKAFLHPPTAQVRARLPGFHTCVGGGGERQTPEWYEEKGISIVSGKAAGVDLEAKVVTLEGEDGESCSYGKLLIATGTRALRVSHFGVTGDDLRNVFYLREVADASALVSVLESFESPGKAVVVGGGYIGLETAAALVGWGFETTMIFPEDFCMPRLFNAELGTWMEAQYAARGVNIVKGDVVTEFLGEDGALTGVQLKNGDTMECNVAVVGVGASPNTEFCTGLEMEAKGFKVDANMQTSDENVWAIGDVCAFPSKYGGFTRCEHVDHARKSAAQAVRSLLGMSPEPYCYLPYFYSRVFEYTPNPIVFNFFGDQDGECRVHAKSATSVGAIWVRDEKVVGALLMGSPGPSGEDQAKLKELVTSEVDADEPDAIFERAGL